MNKTMKKKIIKQFKEIFKDKKEGEKRIKKAKKDIEKVEQLSNKTMNKIIIECVEYIINNLIEETENKKTQSRNKKKRRENRGGIK